MPGQGQSKGQGQRSKVTASSKQRSSSSRNARSGSHAVRIGTVGDQKVGLPRRFRPLLLYLMTFTLLSFLLFYQLNVPRNAWPQHCPDSNYILAIARRATPDRFIVLALVDAAFTDMAINLYEANLKPNNIQNFLFVGAGRKACEILWNASLPCFHYTEDVDSEVASVYLSRDFLRKMNIRTNMILDALYSGFTVLHTDLDVAFLQNPLPHIKDVLLDADLVALWDSIAFNAGFVAVRPTVYGIRVYETMKKITARYRKIDDQRAMNIAVWRMRKAYERSGFRATALDRKRYLCGYDYFEHTWRMFPDDGDKNSSCDNCMIIHNNWIVSKEAKIYRFKEHLLWMHNKEGYYSNPARRYLIYNNTLPAFYDSQVNVSVPLLQRRELRALRTALAFGHLLNRVVVLPRFHCTYKAEIRECPLNSLLNISAFDAYFAGRYRENSFLRHPLVPTSTISSRSALYHIRYENPDDNSTQFDGSQLESGGVAITAGDSVTSDDVIEWFGDVTEKILVLDSLFLPIPTFSSEKQNKDFEARTSKGFVKSNYRQMKEK